MGQTLGVPAAWFFEGPPETLDTDPNAAADSRVQAARSLHAFDMSLEGLDLARLFPDLAGRVADPRPGAAQDPG